jgi:hypothetical protein
MACGEDDMKNCRCRAAIKVCWNKLSETKNGFWALAALYHDIAISTFDLTWLIKCSSARAMMMSPTIAAVAALCLQTARKVALT